MRILVVEDNSAFAASLKELLSEHEITTCYTFRQAMQELHHSWQLIIIDLSLPDGDGLDLMEEIRERFAIPVLVLTGDKNEYRMIEAYKAGIDDYIEKPVRLRVLKEKSAAISRNRGLQERRIRYEGHELNTGTYRLDDVRLNRTQTKLLEMLMEEQGNLVTYERLSASFRHSRLYY